MKKEAPGDTGAFDVRYDDVEEGKLDEEGGVRGQRGRWPMCEAYLKSTPTQKHKAESLTYS